MTIDITAPRAYMNGHEPSLECDVPAMVTVNAQLAEQWLGMTKYIDQRALSQKRVDTLAEEMKRNTFSQGTMIRFVFFNGERLLIDGQHRLWAVLLADRPQSFVVLITTVHSEAEIAWLYANTDIGKARSTHELFGPLHLAENFKITATAVDSLASAINFMSNGCTVYRHLGLHREDLLKRMRVYAEAAFDYCGLLSGSSSSFRHAAMRTPSLSIALLTLRYDHENIQDLNALAFWSSAITDNGLMLGDPRKLVNRHLLTTRLSSKRGSEGITIVSPTYSARYLASCFNAYMEGRELRVPRIKDDMAPLRLHGVPVDHETWWD
jgi:hypothetical protein